MKKTTYTIVVAAVTTAVVLSTQTIWHHYQTPGPSKKSHPAQVPLTAQQSIEAKQTARSILEAFGKGDWEAVAKFWPPDAPQGKRFDDVVTDKMKDVVTGLQIVSLGTPFKEGPNSWVLVPYEARFKSGDSEKNNLRLGKDSDGNWHWQGGF
jgi:hypothetical protein